MKNVFLIYQGFPKAVYFIFIARLINAMGFFVFPFLTLFLTRNLSLGADKVGFYLMLVGMGRISGALLGGKIADHFGRKVVLMGCQMATAVFLFPCAFLEESMLIPKLLIFAAFFNGAFYPSTDAILVDLSHPGNRKEIFSFIYLGLNLGFGIGSLIAGFLYSNYMQLLFLGNVLAIIMACVIVGLYVPETIPRPVLPTVRKALGADMIDSKKSKNMIFALIKQPVIFYFLLVILLFFLVHSQFFFSLPLQINAIFLEQGPRMFGIVMSFNCFIVVLMTIPVTLVFKKNQPIINVLLSGILFAVGFGMLRWISYLGWILLSTFIWTIGQVLIRINAGVYIANHSPNTLRGSFNSLLTISESVSRIIGSPLLGYVISSYGIRQVWTVIFFISLCASILIYSVFLYEQRLIYRKEMDL